MILPRSKVITPRLSRLEAGQKLRAIFKLGERYVQTGVEICRALADFYDDGGLDALGNDDGPMPMSYIGSGLGVTRERVRQLIEAGRAWRRVNLVDTDGLDELTEIHLRPLTKLPADRQPEALEAACEIAREAHKAAQAQREAEGRPPSRRPRIRLKASHVQQAAAAILPPTPQLSDAVASRRLLRQAHVSCAACPGVPAELLTLMGEADQVALAWANSEARP